nr:DMT family transporter [Ardenticatena sp.]
MQPTLRRTWLGALCVLSAALFWGTLGPIMHILQRDTALTALDISFLRALMGGLTLLAMAWLWRPVWLVVARRDIPFFAAYGFLSVAAFFVLYAMSVYINPVPVAVVLLYTAPAFVAVASWRLFGEPMSRAKGAALALVLVGSALVAGVWSTTARHVTPLGLLIGLGSAITYATLGLFGRVALRRYEATTAMMYAFLFGAFFLAPIVARDVADMLAAFRTHGALILIMGLVPTAASYVLYTVGLKWLLPGQASILATIEPVVGTVLAWSWLGQRIDALQILGGACILGSVLLLQRDIETVQEAT